MIDLPSHIVEALEPEALEQMFDDLLAFSMNAESKGAAYARRGAVNGLFYFLQPLVFCRCVI